MVMKQKNIFEKKIKMANSKKITFSTPQIFKKISRKLQGLVLGLVDFINAKDIDVVQPIWS